MSDEARHVTPEAMRPFRALRQGARVAVVASSSPIKPDMLLAGCAELVAMGFVPTRRSDAVAQWRFTAGDDARRLAELGDALADPAVRAVWLARGGYGLTPLLGRLDASALARDPKPIVGESDATALGCWALAAGVPWLHGPMVATALRQGSTAYDRPSLLAALAGEPYRLAPQGVETLAAGRAEGTLWGGCLSLLASLAGTPWMPRLAGPSILVVEDVGVKPYQVHRMLVQLRDAGALEGVAGVVLGDFSDCVQHVDQGYDVRDVIGDFVRDALGDVPVTIGWPIGHASAPHVTLAMGWQATIHAAVNGTSLELTPPA